VAEVLAAHQSRDPPPADSPNVPQLSCFRVVQCTTYRGGTALCATATFRASLAASPAGILLDMQKPSNHHSRSAIVKMRKLASLRCRDLRATLRLVTHELFDILDDIGFNEGDCASDRPRQGNAVSLASALAQCRREHGRPVASAGDVCADVGCGHAGEICILERDSPETARVETMRGACPRVP
jgi:hypothetical protein